MNEKQITKVIMFWLKAHDVWTVKIHGGSMQHVGLPDLLCVVRGRAVWLEVKKPGEVPTKLQKHTLEKLRKEGCIAEVVRSVEDVRRVWEENFLTRSPS